MNTHEYGYTYVPSLLNLPPTSPQHPIPPKLLQSPCLGSNTTNATSEAQTRGRPLHKFLSLVGRRGDLLTLLPHKKVPRLCTPAANQSGGAASDLSVPLPSTKVTAFRFHPGSPGEGCLPISIWFLI